MRNYATEKFIYARTVLDLLVYHLALLITIIIFEHWKNVEVIDSFPSFHRFLLVYSNIILILCYVIIKPFKILPTLHLNRHSIGLVLIRLLWSSLKTITPWFVAITAIIIMIRIDYSRSLLALIFIHYLVGSLLVSLVFLLWKGMQQNHNRFLNHLLILGQNPISETIKTIIETTLDHHYYLHEIIPESSINLKKITAQIEKKHIDEILICTTILEKNEIDNLINIANDHFVKIKLVNHFAYTILDNPLIKKMSNIPMIELNTFPLEKFGNRFWKRCFDILFSSLVILFILSWLTPLLAILLKWESPGGLFHRQLRTGRGGKKFYCLKFRSMYLDQNNQATSSKKNLSHLFTTTNDNRITPIGRFLRKRHLDELPQFINIFCGEMSLVGPRPHTFDSDTYFRTKIHSFHFRYFVNPGITGLAQIMHEREKGIDPDNLKIIERKVKLDKFYINHWTFYLDFKIILLTCKLILQGDPKSV